ncbi:zinc-dependent alcohol dehydrogenase family protein [Streptomyces iconiensis]|uniref:Zinc-dependent alcohol dehydrogenase family protein n=1 Tax=Streptomyces iconiensis TaxID=1384038 RepID=A0ABT7A2W2_9ACTN|nr:zinc-dependent alcohol dehydrogenase family protein [Streptomyces iconiensis]MDJ1135659.1 zinc-dependent alcohol dehydrogenase family protein [Streptomyces iconiensis]
MRAVMFEKYGEPSDVLRLVEVPSPLPGPGEVRVEVAARPVNPSDLLFVQGEYGRPARFTTLRAGPGDALSASPVGFEGAGVVEALGPGATAPAVGTRVAVAVTGTWQRHVCAPADSVHPLGEGVSLEAGCQLTVNPFTAHLLLRAAALRDGDTVLVTAGGSAVGRMIAYLAHRRGLRCVSVVRRAEHARALERIGAVPVLTHPGAPLEEQLKTVVGREGAALGLDAVGGAMGRCLLASLRPGARLVSYGLLSGEPLPVPPEELIFRDVRIEGFWLPERLGRLDRDAVRQLTGAVAADMADGMPGLEVAASYDLSEFRQALAAAARPGRTGKVLLRG